MDQSQIIREYLNEELLRFDDCLRKSVESANPRISDVVKYVFATNGKRLRPILVFLTAKACGEITPATYHGAVTVELLHTASLVHDDVIDESKFRRNKPSANAVFDNTRSVLVGDFLLSSALLQSVETKDIEIVKIMSELGRNLAEGELNQYALANEIIIDEKAYFDVIEKKTASLLRACCTIGAMTGGADRETVANFRKLGELLGISFQIRDDIFDYYKADVGKPTGNDIREGKITLPLIYALQNAPGDRVEAMMRIIESRDYSEQNIETLLNFAKENKGIQYAFDKMGQLLSEAEEIVSKLNIHNDHKVLFELFLIYLKERIY